MNLIHHWDCHYNLVASSPQHGVVFVASTDRLLAMYRVADLLYSKATPSRVIVKLPLEPTHIAVNCDGELLAVVGFQESILIYNVKDIWNQDASPKLTVPRGSTSYVRDMQWSPIMNETLAIGFLDKTTILHVGTAKRIDNTGNSYIRCLSWRPSGSSFVVGYSDGALRVYSHDSSLEKLIPVPAPPLLGGASLRSRAVHWMSNNQLAVVYENADTSGRKSAFTLIKVPEGALPTRAEYVGRLESELDLPRYKLVQIKPWNTMLCAVSTAGIKLLPPDSDGGDSQAPFQLVGELLREDDLYSVGVALNRVPVLRLSSQSHLHEATDETMTLVHVLTQMGDLATYTVGERPSTPSVETESSRPTPYSEPAALEPPFIYSKNEAAECAAPAAEHEDGARARAARRLVETALARLSRLTLAEDPRPAEEESPGGAPAFFCGPCTALVGSAERAQHARSLQHHASVFVEQELEELVREYVDGQDLALLGPPAGAASQVDSLVELSDAAGWYRCALCALRVPRAGRRVHERGRRHGACAALAHCAARRAAQSLRRPGPPPAARGPPRRLHALLQLYCRDDGEPDEAKGDHDEPEGDHDEPEGDHAEPVGGHLHNVD